MHQSLSDEEERLKLLNEVFFRVCEHVMKNRGYLHDKQLHDETT
jgi:hypothetical protein